MIFYKAILWMDGEELHIDTVDTTQDKTCYVPTKEEAICILVEEIMRDTTRQIKLCTDLLKKLGTKI